MLAIGIVGPPAGGKSTVAAILEECGATWINADQMAHEALSLPEVTDKLRNRFGDSIFSEGNCIDRKALAQRVFGPDPTNQHALEYIESVIHPVVLSDARRKIRELQAAENQHTVVLDAPLLIEAGWHYMCDEIWCISTPAKLRDNWIAKRGWNAEQLATREKAQLPIAVKKHHSTRLIRNDGNREQLKEEITTLWREIREVGFSNNQHC